MVDSVERQRMRWLREAERERACVRAGRAHWPAARRQVSLHLDNRPAFPDDLPYY